jgi:hypothetical protein
LQYCIAIHLICSTHCNLPRVKRRPRRAMSTARFVFQFVWLHWPLESYGMSKKGTLHAVVIRHTALQHPMVSMHV